MTSAEPLSVAIAGLTNLATANPKPQAVRTSSVDDVCRALNEFPECVRYLNTRRSAGAVLVLQKEADVQDALYLILRPWIRDLVPENPTDKVGNRYAIKDFVSKAGRFVLEVKYIRDAEHGRTISKELHDDIEVYRHHQYCDTLIFFVYDPESLIPDHGALRSSIETSRVYGGRSLNCCLIVR